MGQISNFAFNCSLYADSLLTVSWMKVSTFIISVLFMAWPPDVEAVCAINILYIYIEDDSRNEM